MHEEKGTTSYFVKIFLKYINRWSDEDGLQKRGVLGYDWNLC